MNERLTTAGISWVITSCRYAHHNVASDGNKTDFTRPRPVLQNQDQDHSSQDQDQDQTHKTKTTDQFKTTIIHVNTKKTVTDSSQVQYLPADVIIHQQSCILNVK